jgi:hypothetical protein
MGEKVLWIATLKHDNPDSVVALRFVEEATKLLDQWNIQQIHGRIVNHHKGNSTLPAKRKTLITAILHAFLLVDLSREAAVRR